MARYALQRKQKKSKATRSAAENAFAAHLNALGLTTRKAYQAWCVEHGFPRTLHKTEFRRQVEVRAAQRDAADSELHRKRHEHRNFKTLVEAAFRRELTAAEVSSPALKAICESRDKLQANHLVRKAFLRLLLNVGQTTDLIQVTPVVPHYGRAADNTYLQGLLALSHHASKWIRQPEDWWPTSHNADRQFRSLARHLFAQYPFPGFMESVWFLGTSREALEKQRWYIHLATGQSIRTVQLPIPYTRRMAHHFMQAPAGYTVDDALRWGQIHALGGNARLVEAILATRLRNSFENHEFWTTVIQFLIEHPLLDLEQVGPVIDYLQHEKFTPQRVLVNRRVETQPPPQPNLTMRGRTPEALLRAVDAWHRTLAKKTQAPAEWVPSGLDGLEFVEGDESSDNCKIWTITELLSSAALIEEGRKMKHCVASYSNSCANGYCSIWALEVESSEGNAKVLTLEVINSNRTLVQARGKCNIMPTQKERSILERWAATAGLQLAKWI